MHHKMSVVLLSLEVASFSHPCLVKRLGDGELAPLPSSDKDIDE
jgi:hypothetical protein